MKKKHNLTDGQMLRLAHEMEAERAKVDLYYLATHVLGYHDLEPLHAGLCLVIESINPLITQLARSHGRDSVVSSPRPVASAPLKTNSGVGGRGIRVKPPTPNSTTFKNTKSDTINNPGNLNELRFVLPSLPPEISECVSFNEQSKHRLFLLHRGSFKTTLISIAHTIQLMLLYPDIRILIASHKKEGGSQEILRAIKAHFTQNVKFRTLFPEYCPKANEAGVIDWGTTEKVTLPNRSDTAIFPEATIEIAGVTTDVTGRHYDVIKADDLVTRDSVTNEQMLEKTEQYNSLLQFLFNQPEHGVLDYAGTPYHFADLYAKLREIPDLTKVIVPVTNKLTGEPNLPRRFTKEGLKKLKDSGAMTSYEWSTQMDLNPISEEDQTFRPEWWKRPSFYYDQLPLGLRYYIFVDPAARQKKDSDYTGLISIGVDSDGILYLADIIRDKLDESGRAKLVVDICKKRNQHRVHYESVGFQSTDHYIIKQLGRERKWPLSVVEMKASKGSKEDRIRSLQPIYERGDIRWPRSYIYHSKYHQRDIDMVEVLKKEFWMFPMAEHDDLIDCHAQLTQITTQKAGKVVPVAEEDRLEMIMRKMILEKKRGSGGPYNRAGNDGRIPYRETPW